MNDFSPCDESVEHLLTLGYADPDEAAARSAALRQQQAQQFQHALEVLRAGREQEATELLRRLAEDDEAWIAPRQHVAAIHYTAGRIEEAQAELEWLTHHGVEHPRLAMISAGIAATRRNFPQALRQLEYAAYVTPTLPGVFTMLGDVLSRLNRLDEAHRAYEQALEQMPNDARAINGLARLSLKAGQFDDAASLALTALEHDMRLSAAHVNLGIALFHIGRPVEAIAALEAAARLEPSRAAPYRVLARIARDELHDTVRADAYRDRGRQLIRARRKHRRGKPSTQR